MIGLGGYGTEEDLLYREDQEAIWLTPVADDDSPSEDSPDA